MSAPYDPAKLLESYELAVANGFVGDMLAWNSYFFGWRGQTEMQDLFKIAVLNGFTGSLADWAAYFKQEETEVHVDQE